MNRRSILKTAGLALAGSALLPFSSLAHSVKNDLNAEENNLFRKNPKNGSK